ncbi:MAG: hypothetical protein JXR68_04410 [Bacteroidales bacterium]|nr:hypothetical protein [Bacteroidales bacterium]
MPKSFFISGLLIILVTFAGCNMAKTYLKQGNYDASVKIAAQKLQRNNKKKKMILILEEAYPKAVDADLDRINSLHAAGQPDRWDEIFLIYTNMNERQLKVERTYPLVVDGREVMFQHVNYNQKVNEAKVKAADYFFNHAKYLMTLNDKFSYRQAFDEFLKAQNYTGTYPDADLYMDTCYEKGLTNLILISVNSTPFQLDKDFMINLIDFPTSQLNSFWFNYYTTDQLNGRYDVYVNITLTMVDVTPNSNSVREYTESKKVEDGWEYKLDADGHFVTDTLGNKIKVIKYKTISCTIAETRQFKIAHIEGSVNYIDGQTRQIFKSVPVAADHTFEHYFSVDRGDQDALSNDTRTKLRTRPVAYPSDIDMIYAANSTIRDVIFNVLMDNRGFIEVNY